MNFPSLLNNVFLKRKLFWAIGFMSTFLVFYYMFGTVKYTADYSQFLVSNRQCRVSNLDPFSNEVLGFFQLREYEPCSDKPLLTTVKKKDFRSTVYLNRDLIPEYCSNTLFHEFSCCYSNVSRLVLEENPDDNIYVTKCESFTDKVEMVKDIVTVKCKCGFSLVYENTHAAFNLNEKVKEKMVPSPVGTDPISVLMIGIDSISRLNFIRALPKTYRYVEQNNWLGLKAYNKIGDNTFPNLMGILSGFNESSAFSECKPDIVGMLDQCPLIWKDYSNFGYITAFAEDEASINTFNYGRKGFVEPPTDYYMRSYILATERLSTSGLDFMTYCTGPETAGERIMNLAKDFALTFKGYPTFGFFWMNTFSHNELNSVSGMDERIRQLLIDLDENHITNNSIIIFFSDHGIRFGNFRLSTEMGWLEERLPFIYFHFPEWFRRKYLTEIDSFRQNSNKLTTPYDLHMTLQHILELSGFEHETRLSEGCPKCRSLLEDIESERSCEDAGVAQHWCTCAGYTDVKLNRVTEDAVINYILHEIYKITSNATIETGGEEPCVKYQLGKILQTSIASNRKYILVKIETIPKAIFETTLMVEGEIDSGHFSLSGDISRLDYYAPHSQCVHDFYIKKYCYCAGT